VEESDKSKGGGNKFLAFFLPFSSFLKDSMGFVSAVSYFIESKFFSRLLFTFKKTHNTIVLKKKKMTSIYKIA